MAATKPSEFDPVREYARNLVRAAFADREEIIDSLSMFAESDGVSEAEVRELVDEQVLQLCNDQKEWPELTDNDRMEGAFENLERQGILVRQDFTCCGSCGAAEIVEEAQNERFADTNFIGYAFFHQQDTEAAVDGGKLYFNFGSLREGADEHAHLAIGQKLAIALSEARLDVNWDGSLGMRVGVAIYWRRRWGAEARFVQQPAEWDGATQSRS